MFFSQASLFKAVAEDLLSKLTGSRVLSLEAWAPLVSNLVHIMDAAEKKSHWRRYCESHQHAFGHLHSVIRKRKYSSHGPYFI
jgi:hypothetical protein